MAVMLLTGLKPRTRTESPSAILPVPVSAQHIDECTHKPDASRVDAFWPKKTALPWARKLRSALVVYAGEAWLKREERTKQTGRVGSRAPVEGSTEVMEHRLQGLRMSKVAEPIVSCVQWSSWWAASELATDSGNSVVPQTAACPPG